ncbi:MAG: efflux RND transporter permease subunit [Steroidobacteraceae bacterium]
MLAALIRGSLRHPALVVVLGSLLLFYGGVTLLHAKYDVFPEFVPEQATLQVEAPGLLAEDVERLVTQPLENAINGGANIAEVRSDSIQGLSVITVVFDEGSDIFRDRQLLAERVSEAASSLPTSVGTPIIGPMTSSTMDLLKVGFTSDKLSPIELRSLVEWTVRPRLLSVPGVARAIVYGGGRREIQIAVKQERLSVLHLGINEVLAAASDAITLRGSGFADTPTQRILIRAVADNNTPESIAATVVTRREGSNITIGDVADVTYAAEPAFGDAHVQGGPTVLLSMGSQYLSNTLDTTERLEMALAELQPMLQERGVMVYPALHRPATFVEVALKGMRDALALGALLVALVLIAFLRSWRTALISFVTIPLSLLFAVLVMNRIGWTINTMTLSGLAVALGVVVDDAIIDVENIVRRLRQAVTLRDMTPIDAIIFNASIEVRRPIVLATVIVGMVFVPILMLPGLQGSFFAPMAMAFLLATFGSLLVALTITPVLCLLLLHPHADEHEPRWVRRLKFTQYASLKRVRQAGSMLLLGSLLLGMAALAYANRFGKELMPMFREGHLVVQLFGPTGTGLSEVMRVGDRVAEQALQIPGVATVVQQAGRAEAGEDTWGPSRSEFHIELKPGLTARQEIAIQDAMHELLGGFPGFESEVLTFLGDRISESISGETAAVSVSVFGSDLDQLDATAEQIKAVLQQLPDAGSVQLDTASELPTLQVKSIPAKLATLGLRDLDVLDAVQVAYAGNKIGQVYQGNQALTVRVMLAKQQQLDPEALSTLVLHSPSGRDVPISAVADLDLVSSRGAISHESGQRRQVVNLNPVTTDMVGFVNSAKQALAEKITLPEGVFYQFGGVADEAKAASRQLLLNTTLAALGIVLLLMATFRAWRSVVLILINVPFALVGGVIAVALTNASLSIGTLVGFVTLFGISARNAIMLVSHYDHLTAEEGKRWSVYVALRGVRERLTPILMTALVTALGLLPLALGSGEAGREIEGPMAVVILGGLISSTVLNLWVLPIIAACYLRAK